MARKTKKEAENEAAAKEEVKAELQQAQEEAQQAAGEEPPDDFMNPPEDPKTGHLDAEQLAKWNKKELTDLAKDLEIKGAHDMSKEDLIAAIVAVEVEIPSEEEAGEEPDAAAGAEDPAEDEAQDADFKKGVEYVAREVLAIYDKADGKPTGKNVYKFDKVKAEAVESKGGRVWLKIDGGFVCAKEGDAVYF